MNSGAASQYDVMSYKDIADMPVNKIIDDDCLLAMWWVATQPLEALHVMEGWGFKLVTMTGFNWVKTTIHGKLDFGMGRWTRAGSELCLIGKRGKPMRCSASVRSVRVSQKTGHSVKPTEFRDDLVSLVGDVKRLEMFARKPAPGWDVFGNQVVGSIKI